MKQNVFALIRESLSARRAQGLHTPAKMVAYLPICRQVACMPRSFAVKL
jgi:hypothetical protein